MKKFHFILPLLAFIMAIGMSFAVVSTDTEDSYALKYIKIGSNWHPVEVECGSGSTSCQAFFTGDPSATQYQVYNTQNTNDPALGDGQLKSIPGSPPNN